jgi:hypothetical protein
MNGSGPLFRVGLTLLFMHIVGFLLSNALANPLIEALTSLPQRYAVEYVTPTSSVFDHWTLSIQEGSFQDWLLPLETFPRIGRCQLPKTDKVQRLAPSYGTLNAHLESLFLQIDKALHGSKEDIELNQFDLWHGHLVQVDNQTLSIVFHTKEYPQISDSFPYPLGFCQQRSNVTNTFMSRRNWIWIYRNNVSRLFRLDADKKVGKGSEYLPDPPFYTLQERELGPVISDIYFYNHSLSFSLY